MYKVNGTLYLPSMENASRTLPGVPPAVGYPEFTYTIPPPMAGPGPSSDPPRPSTPFTVSYVRMVSTSHRIRPSVTE